MKMRNLILASALVGLTPLPAAAASVENPARGLGPVLDLGLVQGADGNWSYQPKFRGYEYKVFSASGPQEDNKAMEMLNKYALEGWELYL